MRDEEPVLYFNLRNKPWSYSKKNLTLEVLGPDGFNHSTSILHVKDKIVSFCGGSSFHSPALFHLLHPRTKFSSLYFVPLWTPVLLEVIWCKLGFKSYRCEVSFICKCLKRPAPTISSACDTLSLYRNPLPVWIEGVRYNAHVQLTRISEVIKSQLLNKPELNVFFLMETWKRDRRRKQKDDTSNKRNNHAFMRRNKDNVHPRKR